MATKNPITGDTIQSIPTKQYSDNYDAIFRKDLNNHLLHDPIDGFNHIAPDKEEEKNDFDK